MQRRGSVLGIDFGTSNTVASLRHADGRTEMLLFDGSPLLPSAVHLDYSGQLLTGRDAQHAARVRPEAFEPNPKRRIDDGTVLLGDRELPVTHLVAAVLGRVMTEARRVCGQDPDHVVLTHPVAWRRARQELLTQAAALAGISTPTLVPEPVAAASSFLALTAVTLDEGRAVVVYDFGGGTFDATVVRRTGGALAVAASEGIADLGGLDIDAAIFTYLQTALGTRADAVWPRLALPTTPSDLRASRTLRDDVRHAKEMLSRASTAHVHIPLLDDDVPIGREVLDRVALPLLDRTVGATSAAVRDAGLPADAVAAIFLVGGSSRIPLAATLLHQRFGIAPTVVENPESVVAQGAVRAADLLGAAAPTPALPPTPAFQPAAPPPPTPAFQPAHALQPTAGSPGAPSPAPDAYSPVPPSPEAPARRRRRTVALLAGAVAIVVLLAGAGAGLALRRSGDDDGERGTAVTASSRPPAASTTSCSYEKADPSAGRIKEVGTPPTTNVPASGTRTATMVTNRGTIEFTLDRAAAPCSSNSFTFLAGKRFFDNTVCHRLVTDILFVLQCGDPFGDGTGGPSYRYGTENLPTGEDFPYRRGTVAMAKSSEPISVGSQFFIVYDDINRVSIDPDYTVVGTVSKGLDVVENIATVGVAEPGTNGPSDGMPKQVVNITSLTIPAG